MKVSLGKIHLIRWERLHTHTHSNAKPLEEKAPGGLQVEQVEFKSCPLGHFLFGKWPRKMIFYANNFGVDMSL